MADAHTLHQAFALALFDDAGRGDQVVPSMRSKYGGQCAVNAFQAAKSGTHTTYRGDLPALVNDTARLAAALRP
ncbi:MAG: hypothetical protein ACRDPY_24105 [Streptosporangiaceae bacterium]